MVLEQEEKVQEMVKASVAVVLVLVVDKEYLEVLFHLHLEVHYIL